MTFTDLNLSITKAQAEFEIAVRTTITATEIKEEADINCIKADSSLKKAKLDLSIYREKLKSLWEVAYNLRAESKIK